MIALISVLLALLAPQQSSAAISGELNCTTYNGTAFVYTPSAVACSNSISDSSCAVLYPATDAAVGWPAAGTDTERPLACYTTATATPAAVVPDMRAAALRNCAKTCGLCCKTDAYDCPNVQFPRLNCATITNSQCMSSQWRTIIAVDCPSACGFCNQGGCVDAVVDCANDRSICTAVGMQDFVNTYCQRTCNRCASSTAASSGTGTGACSTFIADSSTACASWAANGFCTNTFYTAAQRRSYCATTCRLC
uniref:ShKT domain-containing protein n=1 Tax=Caenorhabditis tropicalis TaxID=1561998 RepID=A0A1I7TXR9_9PELO